MSFVIAAPARVIFIPFRGVGDAQVLPPLERKRRAVWANSARNMVIAGLAAGLAADARKALHRLGLDPDGVLDGRPRRRVAVLVEGVEHGRLLAERLPHWALDDATSAYCHREFGPEEADPDDVPPPGRIATLMSAARFGVGADVLVRATGGRGRLGWETIRGGKGRPGTVPQLLIDVADEAGDWIHEDTEARRQEYQEQGMEIMVARRRARTR